MVTEDDKEETVTDSDEEKGDNFDPEIDAPPLVFNEDGEVVSGDDSLEDSDDGARDLSDEDSAMVDRMVSDAMESSKPKKTGALSKFAKKE